MNQIVRRKENAVAEAVKLDDKDRLAVWLKGYFRFSVATAESSRAVQRRDLERFIRFMVLEEGHDLRPAWTPRLSRAFIEALRNERREDGKRQVADRSINRMMAHLKTFASFVHQHAPLPLGHPTEKLPALPTTTLLIDQRALSQAERRKLLDAADLLPLVGGRSKDRRRHGAADKPVHPWYRAWRNRAIIYTLIETGMRRAGIVQAELEGFDPGTRTLNVLEKGGVAHPYKISREGAAAIADYLTQERGRDEGLVSPALFLPVADNPRAGAKLTVDAVNRIWNEVRELAGVDAKTPHSARHAMGRHLIAKTGNMAAVQRQLGHKNASYSMQYARISDEELLDTLDKR